MMLFSFLYSAACNLSEQQQIILDLVSKGHSVYFDGIAGCGKNFVARQILEVLTKKKIEIALLAQQELLVLYMRGVQQGQFIPLLG